MADDEVILQAGATINIAAYESGLDAMVAKTADVAAKLNSYFAQMQQASQVTAESIAATTAAIATPTAPAAASTPATATTTTAKVSPVLDEAKTAAVQAELQSRLGLQRTVVQPQVQGGYRATDADLPDVLRAPSPAAVPLAPPVAVGPRAVTAPGGLVSGSSIPPEQLQVIPNLDESKTAEVKAELQKKLGEQTTVVEPVVTTVAPAVAPAAAGGEKELEATDEKLITTKQSLAQVTQQAAVAQDAETQASAASAQSGGVAAEAETKRASATKTASDAVTQQTSSSQAASDANLQQATTSQAASDAAAQQATSSQAASDATVQQASSTQIASDAAERQAGTSQRQVGANQQVASSSGEAAAAARSQGAASQQAATITEASAEKAATKTVSSTSTMKSSFAELEASEIAAGAQSAQIVKVSDKWTDLARSQLRASIASRELRETLSETAVSGLVPEEEAVQQLAAKLYEATVATEAFKAAQDAVTDSSHRMTGGLGNARIAFTGLTQDLGIRGSRVLASFAAQSETLGPILQKAFAIVAVVAFIEIIDQANKKIAEGIQALAGYGEAAQKAYQVVLDGNRKAIVAHLEQNEKLRDIGTTGVSGIVKLSLEQKNAADTAKDMAAALKEANSNLQRQQEIMQHLKNAADFWHDPLYGLTDATTKLAEGEANLKRYQQTVDELEPKVKELSQVKPVQIKAEISAESFDRRVADEKASVEARKTTDDSYISYYVAGLKEAFTAGKINLDTEVEGEKAAVTAKLEEERRYVRERLAILSQEAKTGKNVTPERTSLLAQQAKEEAAAAAEINAIDARLDEERQTHANAVSLALAEATRSGVEAQAEYVKETGKEALDAQKIDIDEYVAQVKAANATVIASDRDVLNEKLRAADLNPYKNQTEIIALQQQLADLTKKQLTEDAALDAEAARKHVEEWKKAAEERLRVATEEADGTYRISKQGDERQLRDHAISVAQSVANDRAALNQWLAAEIAALETYAAEQKRIFGEGSQEYINALDKEKKAKQQFNAEVMRLDDQEAAQFQKTMNVISSSFSSAFDKMLTTKTTFSKVLEGFWNEMVTGWARMLTQIVGQYVQSLARIVIQHALTALKIQVIDQQSTTVKAATQNAWTSLLNALGVKQTVHAATQDATQTAQHTSAVAARQGVDAAATAATIATDKAKDVAIIQGEAGAAGAAAFASVIEALPFPANVAAAPGVAASAVAQTEAFGAIGAAAQGVAAGGKGMPAVVHPGELITHADVLGGLQAGAPQASEAASYVPREQMVHLAPGAVVVPAAHAPGITNAIQIAGGSIGTAPGTPKPGGITEAPQHLSESMTSVLKGITESYTSSTARQGWLVPAAASGMAVERLVSSAREGFTSSSSTRSAHDGYISAREGLVERAVTSAREGYSTSSAVHGMSTSSADSVEKLTSAREGSISAREGYSTSSVDHSASATSAREGYSSSSLVSAREGFAERSVTSAREGIATSTDRPVSAREGYSSTDARSFVSARHGVTTSSSRYVSAREGLVIPAAAGGMTVERLVSAREGLVTERTISTAREGFIAPGTISSAREGYAVPGSVSSSREGYSNTSSTLSVRSGYVVPSAAGGMLVDRTVSSAREGFSTERYVSSAREGLSTATHILSAREGYAVPGAAGGLSVQRTVLSAREGYALPSMAGGFSASAALAGSSTAFSAPVALTAPPGGGGRSAAGFGGGSSVTNHNVTQNNEINLHHNGPDAREVLEKELAPRVKRLMRTGVLPGP